MKLNNEIVIKIFLSLFIISILNSTLTSQNKIANYLYAIKDTNKLSLDFYSPQLTNNNNDICLIYVFGGGFFIGSKTDSTNVAFCKSITKYGYSVAAIDYRLGMKGNKSKGLKFVKAMRKAISMAEDDVFSATNYLLDNAEKFQIDKNKIIICGSSAGAITVLQADYDLSIKSQNTKILPENFKYAAVISLAGGLLSVNGKPNYKQQPAPTLFLHGTTDNLVKYDKLKIFNYGFFGPNYLIKQFKKNNYPFVFYRFNNIGHEIAILPMKYNVKEICSFIDDYVMCNKTTQQDITIYNHNYKKEIYGEWKVKDLY